MYRIMVFVLLVALGCGRREPTLGPNSVGGSGVDYEGWKTYVAPEAKLEVRFPSEPAVTTASPATGNKTVAAVRQSDLEALGFNCEWMVRDKPIGNKKAEEAYLLSLQASALKAAKGKLLQEKGISLAGAQGREYIIEVSPMDALRCRSYVVGRRVVVLKVWGKDMEAVSSPEANMFLDSLRIGR
jgi:hypothetical protein